MNLILESPYPALFTGIFLLAGLAISLVQTRDRRLMFAFGGVFALMLGMLALEILVVTPNEEVETRLDALAAALEANDVPRVLSHISVQKDAGEIRGRAEWALTNFRITKAKIRNLAINIRPIAGEATAEFDGIITAEHKSMGGGPYPRRFTLHFRRDTPGGPWLVYKYEEKNMVGGP
jgi:hypothetical protein